MAWFDPQGGKNLISKRELIIPNITRSMSGQYRCEAFDEDGTETSYINVTVQCKYKGQEGQSEKEGMECSASVVRIRL